MVFHLPRDQRRLAVVAGVIGNVMEWYDFALYGYMASILALKFFPSDSRVASMLATYGVFAAGFLMRPIGSVVFGWLGDTIGRSRTMLLSVALMVIPTVVLGLLPTFENVGIVAPVLLVCVRLAQGLSVGGEFSSSVTYLVETAPEGLRGLSGSWANVGSLMGMLLGSGMASLVTGVFSHEALLDWAWRLPFVFGGVMGVAAIFLRRHLPKSEQFQAHVDSRGATSPVVQAITANKIQLLQGTLFASCYGSLFYLTLVYLPTWIAQQTPLPLDLAMRYNTLATALLIPLVPLAGWLSDKVARRTHILLIVMSAFVLLAWPLQSWLAGGSEIALAVVQITLACLIAFPCGIAPALFVELFPTSDRLSGYSISFNVGMGLIGGSTPAAVTWLISETGNEQMPAAYMLAMGLVASIALLWIRDRSREPLN